jgi:hypothetical protein
LDLPVTHRVTRPVLVSPEIEARVDSQLSMSLKYEGWVLFHLETDIKNIFFATYCLKLYFLHFSMSPFFLLWYLVSYFTNPVPSSTVKYDDMYYLSMIPQPITYSTVENRPPPVFFIPSLQPLPLMEPCFHNFAAYHNLNCLVYLAQERSVQRCSKCKGCDEINVVTWREIILQRLKYNNIDVNNNNVFQDQFVTMLSVLITIWSVY